MLGHFGMIRPVQTLSRPLQRCRGRWNSFVHPQIHSSPIFSPNLCSSWLHPNSEAAHMLHVKNMHQKLHPKLPRYDIPYMDIHGYTWSIWGRSFAGILAGGYTKATHGLWSWTRALIRTTPHKMWSICVTRVFSCFTVLNVIFYDLFKLVSIFLYGKRDVFKLEYPNRHAVKWSNIDETHTD